MKWYYLVSIAIGLWLVVRKRAPTGPTGLGAGIGPINTNPNAPEEAPFNPPPGSVPMERADPSGYEGTGEDGDNSRHSHETMVWIYAQKNWSGGGGDVNKIVLADQSLYPGFYQNEHGGYYNPSTGEGYPPGTSPMVYGPNAYETGARVRPEYDLTGETIQSVYDPAAADAGYYNVS